ncbi:MAG: signal peptidase I [Clostridia bacterium]|nr:signal peptidase I [Clostridia bacterium]
MKTLKKIGKVALDVLIVIVFIISVVLVIANITSNKKNGEQPNVFGYVISSVQSESMSGTFEKGALVVGKMVDEETVIEKDDIISFYQKVGGVTIINTHRVVDVDIAGGTTIYQTQGDNREVCPTPDNEWKTINDVTAVYKFHIPGVGGFIDFLKEPLGFVLCLVIPMLAFIGWQVYKLIAIYLQTKKEQMLEEAKDGVSDEAKDAIIKEYLAKMQSQQTTEDAEPKDESNAEKGE